MPLTYASVTAKTVSPEQDTPAAMPENSTRILVYKDGNGSDTLGDDLPDAESDQNVNNDLEEALWEGQREWKVLQDAMQSMVNDITNWINTPSPEAQPNTLPDIWNEKNCPRATNPYTFDPFGDGSHFAFRTCSKESTRSSLNNLQSEFPDKEDQTK